MHFAKTKSAPHFCLGFCLKRNKMRNRFFQLKVICRFVSLSQQKNNQKKLTFMDHQLGLVRVVHWMGPPACAVGRLLSSKHHVVDGDPLKERKKMRERVSSQKISSKSGQVSWGFYAKSERALHNLNEVESLEEDNFTFWFFTTRLRSIQATLHVWLQVIAQKWMCNMLKFRDLPNLVRQLSTYKSEKSMTRLSSYLVHTTRIQGMQLILHIYW